MKDTVTLEKIMYEIYSFYVNILIHLKGPRIDRKI